MSKSSHDRFGLAYRRFGYGNTEIGVRVQFATRTGAAKLGVRARLGGQSVISPFRRVIEALLADGWQAPAPVDPRALADPAAVCEPKVTEKCMMVFSLCHSRGSRPPIDLFARYPLDFEALWRDARVVDLEGVSIRIAAPSHLVAMKRTAGRPKDQEDIAALLRIDPSSGGHDDPK